MTRTRFLTKTLIAPALLSATLLGCGTGNTDSATNEYGDPVATADIPYIAVTQIVEHPALDAVRDGLQDKLKEEGYEAGNSLKWEWESAQG